MSSKRPNGGDPSRSPSGDDHKELAKLMMLVQRGSAEEQDYALRILRQRMDEILRGWVRRMRPWLPADEVEDVLQDVWHAVLRYRSYRCDQPLKPWLWKVTLSALRLELQSHNRAARFGAGKHAELEAARDRRESACDEFIAREAVLARVKEVRNSPHVSGRLREALDCVIEHFESGGDEDTLVPHLSEKLGVTAQNARVLLHRVRKQLNGDV